MVGRWNWLRVVWVIALVAVGPGWGAVTLAASPLSIARQKDTALVLAIQDRPRAFAALAERATADNRVRVIVRLNTRFQTEAELSAAAQVDQHAAIRRSDKSLHAELGTTADAYEGLERLPFVIASVNAEGLARLSRSAHVAGVEEDVPDPGHTNSFSRFTLKSVSGYKIAKRLYGGPELEDQPYVFEPRPFSGSETLTLEEDEEKVYYLITIHFTVEYQEYEDGLPSGSQFTWEAMASPVTIHLERQ